MLLSWNYVGGFHKLRPRRNSLSARGSSLGFTVGPRSHVWPHSSLSGGAHYGKVTCPLMFLQRSQSGARSSLSDLIELVLLN